MANILTEGSVIQCPHGIPVGTSGESKLKAAGQAALTLQGIVGKSLNGTCPNSSSNTTPCTKVSSASGTAAKLKVGGQPVAIDSLTGQTDGSTPTPLSVSANQSKLKAV